MISRPLKQPSNLTCVVVQKMPRQKGETAKQHEKKCFCCYLVSSFVFGLLESKATWLEDAKGATFFPAKWQVLRRLFAEDSDGRGAVEDFRDETLSQPLTNALASEAQENGVGQQLKIVEACCSSKKDAPRNVFLTVIFFSTIFVAWKAKHFLKQVNTWTFPINETRELRSLESAPRPPGWNQGRWKLWQASPGVACDL